MSRRSRALSRQSLDKRSIALHLASTFCGHGTDLPDEREPDDDPGTFQNPTEPRRDGRTPVGPYDCRRTPSQP